MQKILSFALLFLFAFSFGQNISGYKNIFIPKQFTDVNSNKFGLNDLLAKKLKAKKYNVTVNSSEFTCEMLKAEIEDISSSFKNKVKIDFKDCNYKTVASFEGKSNIKDFEPGMQDALHIATIGISVSNPAMQEVLVTKEKLAKPLTIYTESVGENSDKIIQIYSNGNLNFNKINLSNGEFILSNPNNSSPYGIFKPSTKKDVFHVQLQDKTNTLGYIENGNIVVELPNSDGTYRKEVFMNK